MRATIDYGIDLGTTNSCIARLQGTAVEIVRNNEGFEYTPSAVWVDRKGRLHVGRRAKEQFEADEENAAIEFKLQMGKRVETRFARGSRGLKPEELSAEVLKSLLGDVRQRLNEEVTAAVITVPADFDLPQCEATKRAAQLAGLTASPLLQEPVAAALAHGFQSQSDNVLWLVYDLGGGTFDAAVIQLRDGEFRVVNHGGDKHLGGKLLDWSIVEELLVPAVLREHPLQEFRRGEDRWRSAFAKLKLAAEQAKIRLSREATAEVAIEFGEPGGERLHFDGSLQKGDVEKLLEPLVLRSLNICKRVLAEKRLGAGDIEKVILVGGPTLSPYLRERLADPKEGLGIPLEVRLDPMTVVAEGAAVFAGTQRLEPVAGLAPAGQFALQLEYKPVGADTEPLVGGKVVPPAGQDLGGFTIEFLDPDAHPPRRSGKLPLAADGTFLTTLWAVRGRPNTYQIELCDAVGRPCPATPDRFAYTLGVAPTDPPLIHSLGVAMANNQMDVFLLKGTALPARKRLVHRTAVALVRGQPRSSLRIPVVEGENTRRADRNRLIGTLEITADRLHRDVPAGSDIEITIEIDQSRLVRTRAFIPLVDEEFEDVIKFNADEPDIEQLRRDAGRERARLADLRRKAEKVGDPRVHAVLLRIDAERMEHDIESSLGAARSDPDAADKCHNRLLDLKAATDEAERALEWPTLLAEAEDEMAGLGSLVGGHGDETDRQQAKRLEREARHAIDAGDPDRLQRKVTEINALRYHILRRQPSFWVGFLEHLQGRRGDMRDPSLAEQLFTRGRQAIQAEDLAGLRGSVQQLLTLLPVDQQRSLTGYGGSTLR